MKTLYSVLSIVSALTIIGMVTSISSHQIYAPHDCAGCAEFQKLTDEYEKNVINTATLGSPEEIPSLLDQYVTDVRALDFSTP